MLNIKIINEMNAQIIDSIIDESSICYNNTRLSKSQVGPKCTIGDNSILFKSKLEGCNVINRGCFISDSEMRFATYTGMNCIIKNTIIGKYCDLSWNLSVGGGKSSLHTRNEVLGIPFESSVEWEQSYNCQTRPSNTYRQ